MADREYIIDIILKARDDTARAFAEATGQLKAYDALLDEQKAKSEAAAVAQRKYAKDLDDGTSTLQRYKQALRDLGLELDDKKKKTDDQDKSARRAVSAYIELENATKKVTRAQSEGKTGTAQYAQALGDLRKAQLELQRSLQKATDLNQQQAQVRANQIRKEFEYQERLEITAKVEAKNAAARLATEREVQKTVESLNRETERSKQESMRRLSQLDAQDARERASRRRQDAQTAAADAAAEQRSLEQRAKQFEQLTSRAQAPSRTLARTDVSQTEEIRATRELATVRGLLIQKGFDLSLVDSELHHIRQEALRDYGHTNQAARDAARVARDEAEAYKLVESAARRLETARKETARTGRPIDRELQSVGSTNVGQQAPGGGGFLAAISQAKKEFGELDTSTSGFTTHLRGALGFTAVTLIQPLIAAVVGLVAVFASLASAAIAAGAAIGTIFLTGVAQAIPVLGVFATAMQRLQNVFGLVQAGLQQQQQRFIAQYETAAQMKLGIDQVAIAQHNLSNALYSAQQAVINVSYAEHGRVDALYSLQQAVRNVGVAELNLRETRLQATRQLQDLVTQETNARLAAEASSLAVEHSQKSLAAAVATGGDVQSAQLQLSQAQAQHAQAVTQAQRAIQDAAPGSLQRQGIQQQVTQGIQAVQQAQHAVTDAEFALRQAAQGVVQAQRAVVDARFQVAQARAQVIEAQQAAQGFNLGTAAQLAYLRSQMSKTELALAGSITRILGLFRGANAYMRPITDAIIGAFVPLTNRLYQILTDPKVFGALRGLATAIGGAIRSATHELTDQAAINGFISLIKSATDNIGPFARIIVDLIKAAGSIAQSAAPFVHQFLIFLVGLADSFSKWTQSAQGKNWLKDFFDIAFKSLEAFIKLALSIGRLVLDIVGVGGGAKTGIDVLKTLQGWVDRTASSIEHHGKVFKELHALWSIAVPTVQILGRVLGSIGDAFVKLATSKQGQQAFKDLGELTTHVLVPAFVRFVQIIGAVTGKVLEFLNKHPALQHFLVDFVAAAAALGVGFKAIGLVFGPLASIIGLIPKLAGLIEAFKVIAALLPEIETEAAIAFLAPLAPIALVVAAIVGLAAVTGNFQNLMKTLAAPFVAFWNQIKGPLDQLGKQFLYFINGILAPFGVHVKNIGQLFHGVFAGMLDVVKTVFSAIGSIIGGLFGDAFRIIGDFFRLLGDLVRGHFGAVLKDFARIGRDILKGIWDEISAIPRLILGLFIKMVDAVLHFLGISSPSKKFQSIGKAMIDGLLDALGALTKFAGWIISKIGQGISALWDFVTGLGGKILTHLWNGIVNFAKQYFNFEKWLWTTIFNAVWGLLGDIEKLGEKIIDAIVKGIKKAPGKILKAVEGLIPKPLKDAANTIGGLLPWNWGQTGGPVGFGYGGGDRFPYMLEGGEHILTKEEVRSAGGHGAVFAMRRGLGGGTQGGPTGYQLGGQVITSGLGSQGQGKVTQGVTGQLGSTLANIRLFITQFEGDWTDLWSAIEKSTTDAIAVEQGYFTDFFNTILKNWNDLFDKIRNVLDDVWPQINQRVQTGLNTMVDNFDTVYKKADKDSYNAFWYILHAASQALQAFGAKPVKTQLGDQPNFAAGGFIGNMGERGRDGVHAVLGRGEAVLNYAHQRVVEPAMQAMYGFGLGKMFQRTGGEHAGGGMGYASGGYVWPFSGPVNWERTDQGVDFSMAPGTKIGPLGKAQVMGIEPNWYRGQPFVWWKLLDGPDAGRYAFVSEQITNIARPGTILNGNQAVAEYAGNGTGIEYGFATSSGQTLARVTGGYTEGEVTAAGAAMRALLQALASGSHVPILASAAGSGGGLGGATWEAIKKQKASGAGVLANLLNSAIGKVTDAANAFGLSQAENFGGAAGGAVGTSWSGPWVKVMAQIAKKFGWSLPDWRWLVNAESSGNSEAVNPSSGAFGLGQFLGATAKAYAKFGALSHDPVKQIEAMAQYILDRYKNPSVAKAFHLAHNWYAKGGFAGDAIPILGHAGEWVLNKAQQMKLGGWLGSAPHKVADALGLTGGKTEFATGGVIGGDAPRLNLTPTVGATGALPDSTTLTGTGTLQFLDTSLQLYNKAQAIITSLEKNLDRGTKKFSTDFNNYLDNLNKILGDGGLLQLANQALDTATNESQAILALAATGLIRVGKGIKNSKNFVRIVTENLKKSGTAQTALEAATTDLALTRAVGDNIRELRKIAEDSLKSVNKQIANFGRVTSKNVKQYRELIGARNTLVGQVVDADSKLAQNAQDVVDKQQTQFQAQLDQTLRGTHTLGSAQIGAVTEGIKPGTAGNLQNSFNNLQGILSKVGPNIALGIAQMSQTIAQTLGDPKKLQISDQAVVDASERQREALQEAYNQAASKAQKDPRWQKVADDLLGQLESATTAVVQAQAQALTDAIQAQDTKAQIQTAALDFRNRLAQVMIGLGDNLGGISSQIGISRDRASALTGQIANYQGLLATAQSQGNQGAINDLTAKIQDLTAQVAEANLQTQQLITAYRQVSVTMLQTQTQASSGFFSAANSIAQTLGAIAGNQNLPALISYAREAAQTIVTEGQKAVQNIMDTMNDPNGPFGANQGQANSLLSQLAGAFQQGPQAFASVLASLAPQLSSFEAGLPSDQQQLFQSLVQSLIDNTTAQVNNTQQLQQLNATTNQQQFTSSAWTMFREAIFNGLGQLLPQYAMQVPSMDVGGTLMSSGLVFGHAGETITPANVVRGNIGGMNQTNHFNIDHPVEVADPVLFGNQVAWRLAHDPNSR